MPYKRNADLVRPWALPGTPGLEHRIGGLEKQDVTGNVSYDPANHEHMVQTRAAKVAGIKPVGAGPDLDRRRQRRRADRRLGQHLRRDQGGDARAAERRAFGLRLPDPLSQSAAAIARRA